MRFVGSRPMVWRALAACIIVSGRVSVPLAVANETGRTASSDSSQQQGSEELPKNSIHQDSPCADQPKSLAQLKRAFNEGNVPSGSDLNGTWVAIGFFGDAIADLSCTGLKRGNKFEEVMLASGYAVQMHVIGAHDQSPILKLDRGGSVTFPFDFGGDASPVYRCRVTARRTLACLIDVYREGVEFKKMSVNPDEIYSSRR